MLITNERIKAPVTLLRQVPIVGSKWNGKPQQHFDSQAGTYWESMPKLSANEEKIQRALLKRVVEKSPSMIEYFLLMNEVNLNVEQSKAAVETVSRPATGFTAGTIAKTGSSD